MTDGLNRLGGRKASINMVVGDYAATRGLFSVSPHDRPPTPCIDFCFSLSLCDTAAVFSLDSLNLMNM